MSSVKNEIAGLVAKKVKIPEDKAAMAVDVIVDLLKQKLPPAIAGQVDGILVGTIDLSDGVGLDDAAGLIGGLLGGKK
jgi:hypothetical protein